MKAIKCQGCKPEDSGCMTCGGYKVVLAKAMCPGCETDYWVRPGVHTTYVGKTFESFDGLPLVVDHGFITKCRVCAPDVDRKKARGRRTSSETEAT
jgi:hypothetical protein